ncbi:MULTISPECIES: hypothetical protein [unclassified Legionella]|uniref:hypothetical protein n=1 Tax=unclassified Legionella TaxID=2622702 RepID=UPI001055C9A9|nr:MULTISPECIES: hypothetical protein [unclassified Legionella]MDI9817932.1 hypothetical protein [Legionella sp. PL877]
MKYPYTAKIYSQDEVVAQKSGDDIEHLYLWMLTFANGFSCRIQGEIIDNETKEIVRKFKESPIE